MRTMEQPPSKCHVLSIQSHVVHGYVGNKCATFPLQVLGFEVDTINSVQFSNHTGYATVTGNGMNEQELLELFTGLQENDLLTCYSHLLTGYVHNANFLRHIAHILTRLREVNPDLIYVCDPVMGDNGSMYVPADLLPIYRDVIVPLADIVTPNQFEVELLTECKISDESDVWQAVQWFHDRGVKIVVISSSVMDDSGDLRAYVSKKAGPRYALNIPKQGDNISFTGTGDLFASLFLAHSYRCADLGVALEKTVASLQAVIGRTIASMAAKTDAGQQPLNRHDMELKLIQAKADLEAPNIILKARKLSAEGAAAGHD